MPPPIPVVLADYDPAWPAIAAGLAARLEVLGSVLATLHHIGSTSVPGLVAKPIIDLMPVVTDVDALDQLRSRVESLGFEWHGELGIAGRRYCTLDDIGHRRAQLHFFAAGAPNVERHLAFRDYLRAHPEAARDYAREKRRARDLHPNDSHAYGDEKAAWIEEAEKRALLWVSEGRPSHRLAS
ncbi:MULTISPECIES: GrpB family protein [Methylosinus]|uniref:GrpB family protein n=1 Tax=Methylosinus trichosporium (strain ATCC 35070 / NCIMB 11131 / UNIQEM 75 / OB3b) TaxID=595536 RepID=A0A2D2D061_METT3|nr:MULTISPECIES: GrpB family protein [Methylosinus]ATQ68380.1 GrpB family protein [Methylosinus trichosporium OB3b]